MAARTEAPQSFKIVFAGSAGVGKTTFLKRHITGEFERHYVPTIGVEVHPIAFETSKGRIVFNCWDTAGQEKLGGIRDGYYFCADAAVVFLAGSPRISEMQTRAVTAAGWASEVRRVAGRLTPVVYCVHRCDEANSGMDVVQLGPVRELLTDGPPSAAYETSAKSNYNFDKPFLWLARQLLGDPELVFTESAPRLVPAVSAELPLGDESGGEEAGASDSDVDDSDDDEDDVLAALEALEAASACAGLTATAALLIHRDVPGCRAASQRAANAACEELGGLSAAALRGLAAAVAARSQRAAAPCDAAADAAGAARGSA